MTDRQQWLAEYARTGSEAAFRELVSRYVDLVYSTALRLVGGDTHRAEDVAQTVFADLARLARTLPQDLMLGGWLHRHTCFVAAKTMRGERRRQSRERQAVERNALQANPGADFSAIAPILDEAINELGEADRTAVLLRFFEQRDFRSVGEALGSSEDAARMRVNRALEKLQSLLKRRGVTTGAAALAVVLSANAVQAAPAGLVVAISTTAIVAGTTAATAAATTTMNWMNLKTIAAVITSAVVAGTATHVIEQNEAGRLREANQRLIVQQESLARQKEDAVTAMTAKGEELNRVQQNQDDLLRLRGEVAQLRAQKTEFGRLRDENQKLRSLAASAQAKASQIQTPRREADARGICINQLRLIDGAMQQCALENNLTATDIVSAEQILPYVKEGQLPRCPSGGTYSFGSLTNAPTCSIPGHVIPLPDQDDGLTR